MSHDTIFGMIDNSKTRFVFTYQDKDMNRHTYSEHAELIMMQAQRAGQDAQRSWRESVYLVSMTLPPINPEHFPLTEIGCGFIEMILLTKEKFKLSANLNCNIFDQSSNVADNTFNVCTRMTEEELTEKLFREYGRTWFRMNSEFDSSELQENIMFQRGVKAAQLGHRFCAWFHDFLDHRGMSLGSFVKKGEIEQELIDRLTSKTLVDLSMSVACKVADGLGITMTQLLCHLEEAGVVESQPREIKDGRIQTTKTLASSDEASSDVSPDSSLL